MPEFKVQCQYYGEGKNKFFHDKKDNIYHKFCVINSDDLPDKYFRSSWKGELLPLRDCWLWISNEASKKVSIDWEKNKDYCFIMNLGENKTAAFNIKDFRSLHPENTNSMVLKSPDYFETTVKKIGFWDSKDYFYELSKGKQTPTKKRNNDSTHSENKTDWGKIALFCLPIVIFAILLLLIIKWVSKKTNKINII